MRTIGAVMLLPILTLAVGASSAAAQDFNEIGSLKGLTFLAVTVSDPGGTGAPLRAHVAKDRIRTVVELELRRNGIRVAERPLVGTDLQLPNQAYADLLVDVSALPAATGFAVAVSVELRQWVTIRGQRVEAVTWDRKGLLLGPPGTIGDQVVAAAREHVEAFLNDYLKANPIR